MSGAPYGRLVVMLAVSFVSMYVLMYAMVDAWSNVFLNSNQFYMAGLMAAPMAIVEVTLMGAMYPRKRLNALIVFGAAGALVILGVLIRQQVAIDDRQFLRSMIPHHAGAILMCQKASIGDAEIEALCRSIVASQQAEIDIMKARLEALK